MAKNCKTIEGVNTPKKIKIINPIDDYSERRLKLIKQCKTDSEIKSVIDSIYADGTFYGVTDDRRIP